eukprot:GHVT01019245.1.p1 GENE.GHVT01019245.1~~GHVT01019245.1.p1  ORF type:complete len:270 (+),score=56.16 GHVT01019245.1:4339-5148(+)
MIRMMIQRDSMSSNFLFQELQPNQVEAIVDAIFPVNHPAGNEFITQGHDGDNWYLIRSGIVDIFVARAGEQHPGKLVCSATTGESFGETALLHSCARAATCVVRRFCANPSPYPAAWPSPYSPPPASSPPCPPPSPPPPRPPRWPKNFPPCGAVPPARAGRRAAPSARQKRKRKSTAAPWRLLGSRRFCACARAPSLAPVLPCGFIFGVALPAASFCCAAARAALRRLARTARCGRWTAALSSRSSCAAKSNATPNAKLFSRKCRSSKY